MGATYHFGWVPHITLLHWMGATYPQFPYSEGTPDRDTTKGGGVRSTPQGQSTTTRSLSPPPDMSITSLELLCCPSSLVTLRLTR